MSGLVDLTGMYDRSYFGCLRLRSSETQSADGVIDRWRMGELEQRMLEARLKARIATHLR